MYEVSCVAGNKVDAAYAVKSLSNVVPAGMGHAVSTQRHGAQSHSYKHKPEAAAAPPAKPDALKSHVMRLLKRSKSHTPATRAADHHAALREFDARRTVFTRPVTDEQRRRRSSTERRRSADKRVMVTIVDGLPVVVTGQGVPAPSAQHQSPHHTHHSHHPPPVMHHRHSHKSGSLLDVIHGGPFHGVILGTGLWYTRAVRDSQRRKRAGPALSITSELRPAKDGRLSICTALLNVDGFNATL